MAKDSTQHFEIPNDMRAFAENSVDQAKRAFDSFISAAYQTVGAFEGQAKAVHKSSEDIRQRAMTFAEQNVASSFDFAQRLVRARTVQEVVQLQTDYVKAQMQALAMQAKELGQTAGQQAQEAAKPRR
jgi:phasin